MTKKNITAALAKGDILKRLGEGRYGGLDSLGRDIPPDFWEDPDFIARAAAKNGEALRYAPEALREQAGKAAGIAQDGRAQADSQAQNGGRP